MQLNDLPPHSRVWVYQSNREFTNDEAAHIREAGSKFVANWAAHGSALKAGMDVYHNRFIVIMVDENQAMASGCSIDSSVGFIREVQSKYQVDMFDRMLIAYHIGEAVHAAPMLAFEQLLSDGTIDENTIVFNNLVATKAEFDSSWKVAVKDSWHARMMPA